MVDVSNVVNLDIDKIPNVMVDQDMSPEVQWEIRKQVAYLRSLFEGIKDSRDASNLVEDFIHTRQIRAANDDNYNKAANG